MFYGNVWNNSWKMHSIIKNSFIYSVQGIDSLTEHSLFSSYHRETLYYCCWTLNERGHLVCNCKHQAMLPHECNYSLLALSVILFAILRFCLHNLWLCLTFYVLLFALLCSFAYLFFYLIYLCSWRLVCLLHLAHVIC